MPWKETHVIDQRKQFIEDWNDNEEPVAELCREHGISRKTGYKWISRWSGNESLDDRSRVPRNHPNQVCQEMVDAILELRDGSRLRYGPKKIRVRLARQYSAEDLPAHSTISAILKRTGRVIDRKKRRHVPPHTQPLAHAVGPNTVWCTDFKGWFLTGDGCRCDPLTITDAFSRYLIRCQALRGTEYAMVRPIFEAAFREFGLPRAIRSDNGPPFASRAVAGLSRLSLWWVKLGIRPERIQPGKPQQNGRHERMHLTLKSATASPPAGTWGKQQERFFEFQQDYNELRPHEGLGMKTPGSLYEPSVRPYPTREPEIEYPDGWQLRRVDGGGYFSWKHQSVFLSEVLSGEIVGMEPLADQYWRAYFGPVFLGVFDANGRAMLSPAQLRRQPDMSPPRPEDRPSAALQDDPPADPDST